MDKRHENDNDSDRARRTPSPDRNPNVFDDEYALGPDEDEFMPTVSDGFRPAGMGNNMTSNDDRQNQNRSALPRVPPLMTTQPMDSDLRRIASRNSTMKASSGPETAGHDSHEQTNYGRGHNSRATAGLQHRESISSTGSFATMARSESPLGTGPSHPYGMYQQNTMARSPSVTTSSTHQPQRSMSLSRPTHPYGMYQQNVTEDDEPPLAPVQAAIPVGFPGLNTNFHRRLGPDGEEQDIVGPDGHAEQLPPYTRYPEEGPTKAAMVAEANATPVESANPTVNAFDDVNAITPTTPVSPLHALPPNTVIEQSTEPQTQDTARPETSASRPAPSTTASSEPEISEKNETTAKNKNWRSKRLWGKVPMGVALILLVLLLVFAIVLGAAIGTFVAKSKIKDRGPRRGKDHEEPSPQVTPTHSLFDASPIPTPTWLPPLPTGAFALPLGIAQESSPSCLTMANQLSAWSCKMTFAPLVLTVSNPSNPGGRPLANLQALTKADGSVQYGVQPPSLPIQPMPMQLVVDLDYKAYGPAFHFSARYDKVVVLNSIEFAAGSALNSRQEKPPDKPSYRHRFQVLPGDAPWFCVWNSTYIEGYIYAKDNSTAATFSAFPTAWPSNAYGSSVSAESLPPLTSESGSPAQTASPTIRRKKRGDSDYPRYPPYPRIVKIEERRLPGSPQPYCQKMRLFDNGQLLEALDSNSKPIRIYLQENDPTYEQFFGGNTLVTPSPTAAPGAKKRSDPTGACHCQWMFQ
ncbi:hypothetical protein B0J11DRAFT_32344 [Dendryphion nanum]|uniref:DUF7820 domain-containing protein n=1 Tax=Dendryphion nanum TaxID=256645 RepID=A0A9P9IX74_9PLEO|nr:hypothetical protein B0J11DRAFT_32344 [Dendryphion nanum]